MLDPDLRLAREQMSLDSMRTSSHPREDRGVLPER